LKNVALNNSFICVSYVNCEISIKTDSLKGNRRKDAR